MFFWTLIFTTALLLLSVFFTVLKRARNNELMQIFRAYNEKQDLNVLTQWIQERHGALRLTLALEYLEKIEEHQLAAELYKALDFDAYPNRTNRVLGIKILRFIGDEDALVLADRLLADHPNDDSVLEIYIDTQLLFERYNSVEKYLLPRLEQKGKGTAFMRQQAQLLAAKGDREKALELMAKVVKKDYMLYKNTLAPAGKKLIYEQFVASQEIYDRIEGKSDKESSA